MRRHTRTGGGADGIAGGTPYKKLVVTRLACMRASRALRRNARCVPRSTEPRPCFPSPTAPKRKRHGQRPKCCPGARTCGSRTVVHPPRALHRPPEVPQPYNYERTTAIKVSAAASSYYSLFAPKTPSPAVEHVFCPACCPAGATGGRRLVERAPGVSLVVGRLQDAHAERPALASADVGGEVVAEGPLAADGPWRLRSPPPYAPNASTRRRPMLAVTAALPETAVAVACVHGATLPAL